MALNTRTIVEMVVTLIVISVLLPLGLGLVSVMGSAPVTYTLINGSSVTVLLSSLVNPTVLTLLTTLLPILVVIGIAMYYIPKGMNK